MRELLRYDEDTAGGRMTTEYLALAEGLTAGQALATLHQKAPDAETVYYVYVIDAEEHLLGVLSLRDLLTAADDIPVAELTTHNVISVRLDDDQSNFRGTKDENGRTIEVLDIVELVEMAL